MEEQVKLLQHRLRQLENPDEASQSIFLFDPYAAYKESQASKVNTPLGSLGSDSPHAVSDASDELSPALEARVYANLVHFDTLTI